MPGGSPTLRICEIGGRVRLGFEGFGHVEEPTLQEAADALVANMVRIAAVYTGVGPASTELAPDLTALDFIWKLGEHVAAGGDPANSCSGAQSRVAMCAGETSELQRQSTITRPSEGSRISTAKPCCPVLLEHLVRTRRSYC